ncbi:MAG: nuclear transport factor 2 family protein [Elusimicrobia bacterium]|nr:nuclear transport factor 2 family protein [Elusimicrobiota bacterium]
MAEALREDIVSEIVAQERKALDRWGNGDPGEFVELSAPEVTYFDPHLERRIDGQEALRDYYASLAGKIRIDRYELLNPKVQVHGDIAVLTFNYVSWSTAGGKTTESRWNCTEVYARIDREWRIIQTHWSLTRPGQQA